jgi:bifunctional UDP-N-acetylglucosamine pyrophosphorylase/glucosamine-1-phosphate N-acetyltransferase
MKSRLAKVLHPLLGRPMVHFPVSAAQSAGMDVVVVVHHQEEAVRAALADAEVGFSRQPEPRGTGHAVLSALDSLPATGTLVVMAGDAPLVRSTTLRALLDAHGENLVTVLSAQVEDAAAYGRLLRDEAGQPLRIVEASEATPEELAIQEINTGTYAFDLAWLRTILPGLAPHPPKGEIYLTDALELAAQAGRAGAICHDDADEMMGVNDRWALAEARHALQLELIHAHALDGVTFEDPMSVLIEADVELGTDVLIGPGVVLRGCTSIGEGTHIGAHCVLVDTAVGPDARILAHSTCEGAVVAEKVSVGPHARLRPGAVLAAGCRVGNFVEVKNADIGEGAKVNHLSYVGDASVGPRANVGAGTITCNYDGFGKHKTVIGADAFIGSNSALVAPITIGDGALVGAGAVVVKDVPADAIAVARGTQSNIEGAARRYRSKAARKAGKELPARDLTPDGEDQG